MTTDTDGADHCLEWMRLLCSSNGKLELKKNAATGYWGSVNRIASLSRHQSFLSTTPLAIATSLSASTSSSGSDKARRMSRTESAKRCVHRCDRSSFYQLLNDSHRSLWRFRRTSELILNRKMSQR